MAQSTKVEDQPQQNVTQISQILPWHVLLGGAGLCACIAEVATLPIDTAKVRLQLQRQQLKNRMGMIGMIRQIAADEGPPALWKGLTAGLQRQLVFASLRLSLYEQIRNYFQGDAPSTSLGVKILSGLTAGGIAISIANPTDLVKVRLQAQGKLAAGTTPKYSGALDAYRKIIREEGIRRLWTGLGPNIARNSVICAAELSTYDVAKEFAIRTLGLPDNTLTHFGCGAAAGFAGTIVGNPIDVVKTRVMNAKRDAISDSSQEFTGALDCFLKTFKNEGPFAFYRGAFPQFARITSWNIVMFVTYEKLKRFAASMYETR